MKSLTRKIYWQARHQQVEGQVIEQVDWQVERQVIEQVDWQVESQVYEQVGSKFMKS